jgi:hypothetical protein
MNKSPTDVSRREKKTLISATARNNTSHRSNFKFMSWKKIKLL